MIGSAGMLRGWAMLWHTDLIYLLPAFALAITFVAVTEYLSRNPAWRDVCLTLARWSFTSAPGLIPLRIRTAAPWHRRH
jgi:hypothetical protein